MCSVVLNIAPSADGFIAGPNGDLSWLFDPQGEDYGFQELMVKTKFIVMGVHTYLDSIRFGWMFGAIPTFVMTHRDPSTLPVPKCEPPVPITFISGDPKQLIAQLKAEGKSGDVIWLMGGSSVISDCINAGLLDEIILGIHPVILGKGTPLFTNIERRVQLKVVSSKVYPNGLILTRYTCHYQA
jgi:dihydrofolate reductase